MGGSPVENSRIDARFNKLITTNGPMVTRLRKAVLTAIVAILHPEKYAVWNGTSECALRELDLFPAFELVEGLIISRFASEKMDYALRRVNGVEMRRYEVEFRLVEWAT